MLRALYRILSVISMFKAFSNGRGGRYMVRRWSMRQVARGTRRIKF